MTAARERTQYQGPTGSLSKEVTSEQTPKQQRDPALWEFDETALVQATGTRAEAIKPFCLVRGKQGGHRAGGEEAKGGREGPDQRDFRGLGVIQHLPCIDGEEKAKKVKETRPRSQASSS